MKTDSNRIVKTFTPLTLKSKLEPQTPITRVPFSPITNTIRPSKKNIFQGIPEVHQQTRSPLRIKKSSKVFQTLFSIRPRGSKQYPDSPTSDLNDITTPDSNTYELGRVLGSGAYAVVRIGTNLSENKKYAIKSYPKEKLREAHKRGNLRREIQIMKKLDHPGIIQMSEALKSSKQVHLVLEYFKGMSLAHFLKARPGKRIQETDAKKVFKQLASALYYLHSKHVSHRDIKLDNILINSQLLVKIIDFGFSSEDDKSKAFCGTPNYMAPEIVMRKEHLTQPADIWALGVVLYVMVTGSFPFKALADQDLFGKILDGVKEIPDSVPVEVKSLLIKMLAFNPLKRPSAFDVLNDPWIRCQELSNDDLEKGLAFCRSPSSER